MPIVQKPLAFPDYAVTLVTLADRPSPSRLLYLLDGDAAMAALLPDWLEDQADLGLVAIGYPDTEKFNLDRRSRDYTPRPPVQWDGGVRRALDRPHGGAAEFLALLTGQIVPLVENALGPPAPSRSLWGHSYGGLFALWAATQPHHGFRSFHAASPSLWWGDYALEQQLLAGEAVPFGAPKIALSMGGNEVSRTGERLYSPERLEAVGLKLGAQTHIFERAGHGPTFVLSLEQAIRTC